MKARLDKPGLYRFARSDKAYPELPPGISYSVAHERCRDGARRAVARFQVHYINNLGRRSTYLFRLGKPENVKPQDLHIALAAALVFRTYCQQCHADDRVVDLSPFRGQARWQEMGWRALHGKDTEPPAPMGLPERVRALIELYQDQWI